MAGANALWMIAWIPINVCFETSESEQTYVFQTSIQTIYPNHGRCGNLKYADNSPLSRNFLKRKGRGRAGGGWYERKESKRVCRKPYSMDQSCFVTTQSILLNLGVEWCRKFTVILSRDSPVSLPQGLRTLSAKVKGLVRPTQSIMCWQVNRFLKIICTYPSVQIFKIIFRRFLFFWIWSSATPPHKIMWYWFYPSI